METNLFPLHWDAQRGSTINLFDIGNLCLKPAWCRSQMLTVMTRLHLSGLTKLHISHRKQWEISKKLTVWCVNWFIGNTQSNNAYQYYKGVDIRLCYLSTG